MSNIIFFGARLPLTKTIVGDVVSPYPNVSKLTSYHEKFSSLADLYALLVKHAGLNHCLFNGQLKEPLENESRAGKTLRGQARDWVVLDFDKVPCKDVSELLPPYCRDVSYIVQKSSTMFMRDDVFSGHVFFQLAKPQTEEVLKSWFERVNFDMQYGFSLTGSATTLHWPLDRSAAFDSKLIYIAPPICRAFTPLLQPKDAIYLVKNKKTQLALPHFSPVTKQSIDSEINRLRVLQGLPEREFKTKPFEDTEILLGAEPSVIHSVKAIGQHYIKFNIGNGDSMGYWIDLRNPHIVRNFKDEPLMLTQEVDEKFFKHLVKIAPRITAKPPMEEGSEVFSIYATNREAQVMTGLYIPTERHLRLDNSNLNAAAAWLAEYGVIAGGPPRHVDVIFDPTDDGPQYIAGHSTINTFRPTDYMTRKPSKQTASTLAELPPLTAKLLHSVLGNPSEAVLTSFVNWLAFIFQKRQKATTAWVWSGVEGTGKGMVVEHILQPLLGPDVVRTITFDLIESQFNAYLENALLVVCNEASIDAVKNNEALMMKLYHWITDSPVEIHAKNKNPVKRPSFTNFIFCTNGMRPVIVSGSNRRFNITDRQETRFIFTPNEFEALKAQDELGILADMLHRWPIDEARVRTLIETEHSKQMHVMTTPINAQIAEAIRTGDIQFFIENMPSDVESSSDFGNKVNPLPLYKGIVDAVLQGQKSVLPEEDLYVLFRTLIPNPAFFQDSSIWRRKHYAGHGLIIKPNHDPHLKTTVRGVKVTWRLPKGIVPPKPKPTTKGKVVVLPKRGVR